MPRIASREPRRVTCMPHIRYMRKKCQDHKRRVRNIFIDLLYYVELWKTHSQGQC